MLRISRMFLIAFFFGYFILLSTLLASQNQVSNKTFKNRAVSLKVLEERLKECMLKAECPQNFIELCGLTKIDGYVMDEENNDIILIGKLEGSSPPLYLEDFVIALRNVWWKYASVEGYT